MFRTFYSLITICLIDSFRIRFHTSIIKQVNKLFSTLTEPSSQDLSQILSSPPHQVKAFTRVSHRSTNPSSGEYDFNQWSKAFRSQLNEFDYIIEPHDIEGKIPISLRGTLFRSMPARFERGGKRYGHYLDGDGYLTKLTIEYSKGDDYIYDDGNDDNADDNMHSTASHRIRFQSKFIQTKEYMEEQSKQQIIYRSTFRTQRNLSPRD